MKSSSHLNVVLIVVDTGRVDRFGCYGHTRGTTPAIDDLARGATVFDRMIAPAAWTLPIIILLATVLALSILPAPINHRRRDTYLAEEQHNMPEIDSDHIFGFDTLSVHAGQRPDLLGDHAARAAASGRAVLQQR